MFKLLGKKITTILRSKSLLNWTYRMIRPTIRHPAQLDIIAVHEHFKHNFKLDMG